MSTRAKAFNPNLSAAQLRKSLENHRLQQKLEPIATFIDSMATSYKSLAELSANPSPELTKQGWALKFAKHRATALESAKRAAVKHAEVLHDLEKQLRSEAEIKAGLHSPLGASEAAELRMALRQMRQEERDAAIVDAAERGDVALLRAVRESPSRVLVGHVNAPLDEMVAAIIHRANPDLQSDLDALNEARTRLELGCEAFVSGTHKMRDIAAEDEAAQQAEAVRKAEAALAAVQAGV